MLLESFRCKCKLLGINSMYSLVLCRSNAFVVDFAGFIDKNEGDLTLSEDGYLRVSTYIYPRIPI